PEPAARSVAEAAARPVVDGDAASPSPAPLHAPPVIPARAITPSTARRKAQPVPKPEWVWPIPEVNPAP
ncbi:MAG TPA: dihydrolipoyllysine-residue succinyltransferase, partial [Acidimicrobiales bacterium]|nr:dihydrolipoyllysine-residue succinyltransferase [Acidimicrobiales bacterium]